MSQSIIQKIKNQDLKYQKLLKTNIPQLYPSNPNYNPKFTIHGSGCREKYQLLHLPIFRTAIYTALHIIENHQNLAIMITASHNPLQDNGIKIGYVQDRIINQEIFKQIQSCLNSEKIFLQLLSQKINKNPQKITQNLKNKQFLKSSTPNFSYAFIGIDCRPSSIQLSQIVIQAFQILNINLINIGLCSTPELFSFSKFFIEQQNPSQNKYTQNCIEKLKLEFIKQIQYSFNKIQNLLQQNQPKIQQTVKLDFSNGSGSISFQKYKNLPKYYNFIITNNKNFNSPNHKCGADYFQRNWHLTQNNPQYNQSNYTIFFDGDCDRIIIKIQNIKPIFDGNHFTILYIKTLIKIKQQLFKSFNHQIHLSVVGISIMNLGLIKELNKYSIPYHTSNIGIQNLFETALKINKIVVFFEPNGHGGIYFPQETLKNIQNLLTKNPNNIHLNILSSFHTLLKNNSRGYALHNMFLFFICKKYLQIKTSQQLISLFQFSQQYIQNFHIKIQFQPIFITNNNNPNQLISPLNFINQINHIIQENSNYLIIIRKSQTQKSLIRINVQGNNLEKCKKITENIIQITQQLGYLNHKKQKP